MERPERQDALVSEDPNEQRERCHALNRWFREGGSAYETDALQEIRKAAFPILVDFNNVLVNNEDPIRINPAAQGFLESLSTIGDVFITTTARNWDAVATWLEKIDPRIFDKAVLLVSRNYYPEKSSIELRYPGTALYAAITDYLVLVDGCRLHAQARIPEREPEEVVPSLETDEFDDLPPEPPQDYRKYALLRAAADKSLAPIFLKPWNIPLIDDYPAEGVGIELLKVYPWPPEEKPNALQDADRLIFAEVIARVREIRWGLEGSGVLMPQET